MPNYAAQRARSDRALEAVQGQMRRPVPRDHGRWLAEQFTDAKLVEIEDSYTLIPEDQPERLARELREFVKVSPVAANGHIVSSGPPGFEQGGPE